jgi:hypothetical protein
VKNYDVTLRMPYSPSRFSAVEEAAARMPGKCTVRRSRDEIHVDCSASAYDMDGAYRYMWKALSFALASRTRSQTEQADDSWRDLAVDHMMQLRVMLEQFAELYPAAQGVMMRYGVGDHAVRDNPVLLSLSALQEKAQEFLAQLASKEPVAT